MVHKNNPKVAERTIRPAGFRELGSTGLKRFGGYVQEEFLPELGESKSIDVYTEMRNNDALIGAIIFSVTQMIRQSTWRVEPASSSDEDTKNSEFVEECLDDMSISWDDTVTEILSMLVYGWHWAEIVYKIRGGMDNRKSSFRSKFNDGKIGWKKFATRSQSSLHEWEFTEDGGVAAMIQMAPPDYKLARLPIERGLLFRPSTHKNNPHGQSILRTAYRSWYFKKHIEQIEGIGIERDLAGLPVIYAPATMLQSDAEAGAKASVTAFRNIIRNIRRDDQEGVIFPLEYDENGNQLFKLELLSSGGQRQFDTNKTIQRYDQQMAMSVLSDFILLGHESFGSFALSQDKIRMFTTAISSWMDAIADVINRHAIPRLFELNGMSLDGMPEIKPGEIYNASIDDLAKYIRALSGSNMPLFPDKKLENHLRTLAGLPIKNNNPDDVNDIPIADADRIVSNTDNSPSGDSGKNINALKGKMQNPAKNNREKPKELNPEERK